MENLLRITNPVPDLTGVYTAALLYHCKNKILVTAVVNFIYIFLLEPGVNLRPNYKMVTQLVVHNWI